VARWTSVSYQARACSLLCIISSRMRLKSSPGWVAAGRLDGQLTSLKCPPQAALRGQNLVNRPYSCHKSVALQKENPVQPRKQGLCLVGGPAMAASVQRSDRSSSHKPP